MHFNKKNFDVYSSVIYYITATLGFFLFHVVESGRDSFLFLFLFFVFCCCFFAFTDYSVKIIRTKISVVRHSHWVVIYGEDAYSKKVVFHLSSLKPKAEMVSESSRGRYDFDKPEILRTSISNQIGQINKIASSGVFGLKAQDPPSCRVLSSMV